MAVAAMLAPWAYGRDVLGFVKTSAGGRLGLSEWWYWVKKEQCHVAALYILI